MKNTRKNMQNKAIRKAFEHSYKQEYDPDKKPFTASDAIDALIKFTNFWKYKNILKRKEE